MWCQIAKKIAPLLWMLSVNKSKLFLHKFFFEVFFAQIPNLQINRFNQIKIQNLRWWLECTVHWRLKIEQWFEAEHSQWFERWLRGHKYQIYKSTIKIKIKDQNLMVTIFFFFFRETWGQNVILENFGQNTILEKNWGQKYEYAKFMD